MVFTDLPLDLLETYRGSVLEPEDFDAFWSGTIAEARSLPVDVRIRPADAPLTTIEVSDVSFRGFGGDRIAAWLVRPAGRPEPLPVIVEYLGYGGGRGLPTEHLLWASGGFAHLVMDTRGQGSGWSVGVTGDPHGSGPAAPGVLTRGIERPQDHYYRRLTTDAVRAVDAARALPGVDRDRVVALGISQGGGLALAVGGLVPGLAAVVARVPFLCDIVHSAQITDSDPYHELVRYLAVHREATESAAATMSYFDGVLHAARGTAPAWFSAALMDATCPPSGVFAARNAWGGDATMRVYPYNGHEGGGPDEDLATLTELRALL